MKKSTILALAMVLATGFGAGPALAQDSSNGPDGPPNSPMAPYTGSMPPTMAPSTAYPPSIATSPPTTVPEAAMPAGGPIRGDAQAKARLKADGYRNVTGLRRGADGLWRATATRGAAKLNVMVDPRGNVLTR